MAQLFIGQYYAQLLSHGVADLAMQEAHNLARLGTEFRTVGSDLATFVEKFQASYLSFKVYHDQETFDDEQALLHEMLRLKAETLLRLQPLLDPVNREQLKGALDQMAVTRAGLIQGFGEYLEPMNTAADEIKALLDGGDVAAATTTNLAIGTQISPSLRRSKELLGQISAGIGTVQAA